jgi:hypothetical protein
MITASMRRNIPVRMKPTIKPFQAYQCKRAPCFDIYGRRVYNWAVGVVIET